jgi:hypothetical protein
MMANPDPANDATGENSNWDNSRGITLSLGLSLVALSSCRSRIPAGSYSFVRLLMNPKPAEICQEL